MVHGGPYPATSDSRSTSVGSLAIERFQRPVAYQDVPAALLPAAVRDDNPWGLRRRLDGEPAEVSVTIAKVDVVPVAGHDSMLLNLSGAHGPFFTRNIVDPHRQRGPHRRRRGARRRGDPADARGRAPSSLVGQPVGDATAHCCAQSRARVRRPRRRRPRPADLRPAHHHPRRHRASSRRCSTCSGQHLGVPVAALLGEGQQRDSVPMLGYLFYVGDRDRTDLPYLREPDGRRDDWLRLRHEEALTPEAVVAPGRGGAGALRLQRLQAQGRRAAPARRRSRRSPRCTSASPRRAITLDPNGGWLAARTPSRSAATCGDVLAYAEDPCGAEDGFSGPRGDGRVPARDRPADRDQHDRHRLAPDGPRDPAAARSTSRSPIRTSGPCAGSVRVAQLCHDWGLTWGSHSNNHFDVSLAMFTHVGAAAPGEHHRDRHALDLAGRPAPDQASRCRSRTARSRCPTAPGLGVELDMDAAGRGARAVPASTASARATTPSPCST